MLTYICTLLNIIPMRTFHTHNECEPESAASVKIGRSESKPIGSHPLYTASTAAEIREPRIYSEFSPLCLMQRNLSQGKDFIIKQRSNLLEIERVLGLFNKLKLNSYHSSSGEKKEVSPNRIFIHSLRVLSSEKFMRHSLFGNGSDPPIRIHLRDLDKESTHAVPILPLFDSCSFIGILHSGNQISRPSEKLINECSTDVLQLILKSEVEVDKINHLLTSMSTPKRLGRKEPVHPLEQRSKRIQPKHEILSFLVRFFNRLQC